MTIKNWFTAVVEDVNDPLQLGRVRVRCFDYHTPSQNDLPTTDLPWSTCIMPVTSPSISGIGTSPVGLLPGSWVFGFFRDGEEMQDSVILGSIPSSSAATGERGNGFADPHGIFPLLSGADIPAGATSYGYGNNPGYANQSSFVSSFNNTGVGQGSAATTFQGPLQPVNISGSMANVISIARGEVGVIETSKNQGPGIAKYWTATSYASGYNNREPWCAAFVSWCIKTSNILPAANLPNTASAFAFEPWARKNGFLLTSNPTNIKVGDIIILSISHIGIATTDSDINGTFRTIEGNTNAAGSRDGNGVWEKERRLSSLRSSITINK